MHLVSETYVFSPGTSCHCNKQVPDSGLSLQLPRDSRTCMLWQFYTAGLIEIEYNASIFIKYQGYHEIALIPNSRVLRLYFLYFV